ncbi:hypothetical protein HS088_TW15G00637 [Tripterygium wilfordii]|uniref:Uncharacterized protein n=2 Tax=Tripterygium wilfordii TaxID=458696 RepID=A0A7J7CM22_TRIWF|nr:hypothetical protein HS088_TW15G00637 [Tripterygium wilfordii]
MRLVGKLCYLPGSPAYGFGLAAIICLSIAQIAGNLVICRISYSREKGSIRKAKRPKNTTTLLVLSWVSFGIAAILLGVATSMSRKQPYGKGWSRGECYLVKNGVFIGSGVLVMVNVGAIIRIALMTIKKTKVEQEIEGHAQVG